MMIVTMGTPCMTSMAVLVQNGHDEKITAQSEYRSPEHEHRFFYNISINDPFRRLEEQLSSDEPNNGYVRQCSKWLQFLIAKGK